MLPSRIAEVFERQAGAGEMLGSPFTGRLCRALASVLDDTTETGRRLIGWPGNPHADLVATRLCGGLHRLVLAGDDEALAAVYPPNEVAEPLFCDALRHAIAKRDRALCDGLASPPQTNEIARSAMLLPGVLAIARETGLPLALCEIGGSAGLNLQFDRFGYRYGETLWGEANSPVQLGPEVRGKTPRLDGYLRVLSRTGCDIAPVDVSTKEGRLRLRAYVWADQARRLERLDGALALHARDPVALVAADAAVFVRTQLGNRSPDAAFVVFHSIMWQYMPRETKDDVLAALAEAGAEATPDAPIARLRMEPLDPKDDFATLSLTVWPGGETRRLARCDFHGRWIEWLE